MQGDSCSDSARPPGAKSDRPLLLVGGPEHEALGK
jgi:hypothetical protein